MSTFHEQMAADLPVFLADFGVDAVWKKVVDTGPPEVTEDVEFKMLFDKPYDSGELQQGVDGRDMQGKCIALDVDGIAEGAIVEVESSQYEVAGPPRPDGTGMIVLILMEAE